MVGRTATENVMIGRLGIPRFWVVTALLADVVVVAELSVGAACAAVVVGGLTIRLRPYEPFVAALALLAALPAVATIRQAGAISDGLTMVTLALILLGCVLLSAEQRRDRR
jgi:hypothetical protein